MKLLFFLPLFSLLTSTCSEQSKGPVHPRENEKNFSLLVFSKTTGFRHESIPAGIQAIENLGKQHGFEVSATEDASWFTSEKLERFKVVVFLNTTLDVLDGLQQAAFETFIRNGGGFVGVHSAADTEYDWPWYGKLVGAYFDSHPEIQEAVTRVIEPSHASTSMLPEAWVRTDEWYNYKNINPDIQILCTLDESTYEGGKNGDNHPISWCHTYNGGRAWYTGHGHRIETYSDSLFLLHLLGGIRYAAEIDQ